MMDFVWSLKDIRRNVEEFGLNIKILVQISKILFHISKILLPRHTYLKIP